MNPSVETLESLYKIPLGSDRTKWSEADAYAFCKTLTVSHYENFPVGSLLVPRRLRHHVHAIYAFARIADDFSDEAFYEGQRLERLEDWDRQLTEAYNGNAEHPAFIALARTVDELDLPIDLFRRLLRAFTQDCTVRRFQNREEVLGYCRNSADPVGRLILLLFGYRDDELFHYSDCICTALQLTNFWQDVEIDLKKDRVYIPMDDMAEAGYPMDGLFARRYDERYFQVLRKQALWTWELFDEGYPLLERTTFPLSAELRFTWLGGTAILRRNAENRFNVFEKRPKLRKTDFLGLGLRSLAPALGVRNQLRAFFESI